LGRPRCKWENSTRIELREIGMEVVDLMHLTQYRDQWWAMNLSVP